MPLPATTAALAFRSRGLVARDATRRAAARDDGVMGGAKSRESRQQRPSGWQQRRRAARANTLLRSIYPHPVAPAAAAAATATVAAVVVPCLVPLTRPVGSLFAITRNPIVCPCTCDEVVRMRARFSRTYLLRRPVLRER